MTPPRPSALSRRDLLRKGLALIGATGTALMARADSAPADSATPSPNSREPDLWPGYGAFWHEASAAWPEPVLARQITMAIRGQTPGTVNLVALHPFYDPWKPAADEAAIRRWCRQKILGGYDGVAVDYEGWLLKDPRFLEWIHSECHANSGKCVLVPKIYMDHQMKAWNWTYEQAVQWADRYSDALAPWTYNARGPDYLAQIERLRQAAYRGQIMPVGDGGYRPDYGGITPHDAIDTIHFLARRRLTFTLFAPHHAEGKVMDAMRAAYGEP